MFFPLEGWESYLKIDGEQLDANTGFYNLRARWMNPSIGRFQSMDTDEGNQEDPLSLHKYVFGSNNPENEIDPSGNDDYDDGGVLSNNGPHITWNVSPAGGLLQASLTPLKLFISSTKVAQSVTGAFWGDSNMNANYILVQWAEGSVQINGSYSGKSSANWFVDNWGNVNNAAYTPSKLTPHVLSFQDAPGPYYKKGSNMKFSNSDDLDISLHFKTSVYSLATFKAHGYNTSVIPPSAFVDPLYPTPAKTISWDFEVHETYGQLKSGK